MENEHAELQERLAAPELYRGDPELIKAIQTRLAGLADELAAAYVRWEALEARAAQMDAAG
jgi:hypothetical protein